MTICKYTLDFTPVINEYLIEDTTIDFATFLSQINSRHGRTDLDTIIYSGSYIYNDEEIESYLDDVVFFIFPKKITFSLFTNTSLKEMQDPILIELDITLKHCEIIDSLKSFIISKYQIKDDFGLSLYFTGGIKMNGQYGFDNYLCKYPSMNHNLYAILTPNADFENLKTNSDILQTFKLTQLSMKHMIGFIAYLHDNGYKDLAFIQGTSTLINFAPFFTEICQELSTVSPLISVTLTSMLLTFCHGLYPHVSYTSVLEYLPNIMNYVSSLYTSPKALYSVIDNQRVYSQDFSNSKNNSIFHTMPSQTTILSNNTNFHPFPTNSIIRLQPPRFATNGLLFIGKEDQTNVFENPLTKEILKVRYSRHYYNYSHTSSFNVNPSVLKQIILVLVDRSIHIEELNLKNLEERILSVYSDESNRYKLSTLHAIMTFSDVTQVLSKMNIYSNDFHTKIRNSIVHHNKARLMNAISDAVDYLNGANTINQQFLFPDAQLRIVLITSGFDDQEPDSEFANQSPPICNPTNDETQLLVTSPNPQGSSISSELDTKRKEDQATAINQNDENTQLNITIEQPIEPKPISKSTDEVPLEINPEQIIKHPAITTLNYDTSHTILTYNDIKSKLYESNVILDSFIMNKDGESVKQIARLSHLSGGSCFVINNENSIQKALSQEAFLSIELRDRPPFGSNKSDEFDLIFPNRIQIEAKKKTQLFNYKQIPNASNNRSKRILQEFSHTKELTECCISSYMTTNINEWRVFMQAPSDAQLDSKWFYLLVEFPMEYPSNPPLFRFISIPFHANISDEGRICMNYLDKDYHSSLSVGYILMCIRALLGSPNYDDSIDARRTALRQSDPELFDRKVKESAANGKDKLEHWLDELGI